MDTSMCFLLDLKKIKNYYSVLEGISISSLQTNLHSPSDTQSQCHIQVSL